MNKRLALGMVVFATTVWAQDNLSGQIQAGCGPDRAKFEVRRQAHSHPTAMPESGKALVYVFGDSELDNTAIRIGGLITRVGRSLRTQVLYVFCGEPWRTPAVHEPAVFLEIATG
jgi:hypothetical protein